MKKLNHFLVVVVSVLFILSGNLEAREVPSLDLRNLSGDRVDLKSYAENEKITVIAFWATWCSPCRQELENIHAMLPGWKEQHNMEFVAISIDDSRTSSNVRPFVNGKGWEFDVLLDENEDSKRALNYSNVPYSIIIDQNGRIVQTHAGYSEGDEYLIEDYLNKLSQEAEKE